MSDVIIPTRFQWRRDTAANWTTNNPTPKAGEPCLETDTGFYKIGDGTTAYNSLLYTGAGLFDLSALTDGYVPAWDAANSKFVMVAQSGGGGTGMTYVGAATVTGSAATAITLSGLDLAADGRYFVQFSLKNATASSMNVSLFYNGDTTSSNYTRNQLLVNVTPASSRASDALIAGMDASSYVDGEAYIKLAQDGLTVANSTTTRNRTTAVILQIWAMIWGTAANVTSMSFTAATANGLAVGSYFKVWKIN